MGAIFTGEMMKVSIQELKDVTRKVLLASGYDDAESDIIMDVLMYAQLRGNNQGIVKLIGAGMPKSTSAGEITIERETKLSALLNGADNQGMVVVKRAVEIAIEKAREHGFGMVGTNNTRSSTGAIGYWAREVALQGFIGWAFAGSPPTVATFNSYEPVFGTNPLAIGLPSAGDPLVLDLATSAMAWFGLMEAKTAGRSIPNDVAYDNQGNPTTDPAKALEGALRPFDRSYKGSGLGLMVEALTGPLVGAAFAGLGRAYENWGNLIMAIDPELLVDAATFKQQVSELVTAVKSKKKLPGVDELLMPGERGDKVMKSVMQAGEIEVEDNLWDELRAKIS
jgi:LDH2 family malate/lactate/ureidoglycolate dehydrogenase